MSGFLAEYGFLYIRKLQLLLAGGAGVALLRFAVQLDATVNRQTRNARDNPIRPKLKRQVEGPFVTVQDGKIVSASELSEHGQVREQIGFDADDVRFFA
jgi:hypothetical protein